MYVPGKSPGKPPATLKLIYKKYKSCRNLFTLAPKYTAKTTQVTKSRGEYILLIEYTLD